eukprot:4613695-Prymnesium_polylepis.1
MCQDVRRAASQVVHYWWRRYNKHSQIMLARMDAAPPKYVLSGLTELSCRMSHVARRRLASTPGKPPRTPFHSVAVQMTSCGKPITTIVHAGADTHGDRSAARHQCARLPATMERHRPRRH